MPRIDHASKDRLFLYQSNHQKAHRRSVMNDSKNSIVYRGVRQTRKSISSTGKRRSLSKIYRGCTYKNLPKEPHKPCKHIYRGSTFVA